MPLPSSIVGSSTAPRTTTVDARWTMAYAAAVGEEGDAYYDTTAAEPVPAPPLFPVCVEWPSVLDVATLLDVDVLPHEERARGVHATHDLTIHRPVRAGDVLTTVATVEAVARLRPGALEVIRLDTTDAAGAPVCSTRMGVIFLGVEVEGPDRRGHAPPSRPPLTVPEGAAHEVEVPVPETFAHVYSAGSQIWNPIHTDRAFARAAGLERPVLHGTATLALAVREVVLAVFAGDPTPVRCVTARFASSVVPPDRLRVRIGRPVDGGVPFAVLTAAGEVALRDGLVLGGG